MINARTLFQPTILFALALMAVIVMMILPMPAWVLDIGLATSFALAILTFTITLFIERPLDFSAFPTILLASLMLRLSLNVSSTKLIIGEGHNGTSAAGGVIEGFSRIIVSGYFIIALMWAAIYSAALKCDPEAILHGGIGIGQGNSTILYYSLITLTTQGYGEIVPANPYVRILAGMEGAFGSIYLAVLIAVLVSEVRRERAAAE